MDIKKIPETIRSYYAGHKKLVIRIAIAVIVLVIAKNVVMRPRGPKGIPPRPVHIGETVQKDIPIYVDSFGSLTAINSSDVRAQVAGKIIKVSFEQGDHVAKGDLLFTIDPVEYNADLEKARAQMEADMAQLKLKQDTLERNRSILDKNLISKQDFDKFDTDVQAGLAQVKLDQANLDLAKVNVDYCYIRSPIDGVAGKRNVDVGNIVTANDGPILVNVKELSTLYVDFTIPERNLADLRNAMSAGQLTVEITVEGDTGGPYTGDLKVLDNTVDNQTGTIFLRALVDNKDKRLWPGQFARVKLILGTRTAACLAPFDAVQLGQKGSYVFIVTDDDKADLRQVDTGSRQGDYIEIPKGLEPGQKVVVSGQMGLSPGVPVIDLDAKAAAQAKKTRKK